MRITLSNFTLQKADPGSNDKLVPIRMIANTLLSDRENQRIAKEAFSDKTVKNFLSYGLIDWHHQSKTGATDKERSAAILGRPTGFSWEMNLPVVTGALTKSNEIVSKNMLPHLEAGNHVFGASVGGSIRKARHVVEATGVVEEIIDIYWDHIAIAGSSYVIAPGSEVRLNKADSINRDAELVYPDWSALLSDFAEGENSVLAKALMAGENTTQFGGNANGFSAVQPQSLEGYQEVSSEDAVSISGEQVLELMARGIIGESWEEVRRYLDRSGVPKSNWDAICKWVDAFLNKIQ